jgi:DNA polymerase III delta prime subunit
MTQIDFKIVNGQKVKTANALLTRLGKILDEQKIPYDKKVLAELIQKYYPDFRKTINELQRYSVNGKIDSGIFYNQKESDLKSLYKSLKGKEFDNMRKWVVNNSSMQPADLFRTIYSSLKDYLQPTSVPQAILLLAGYQYKSAFVSDQEINMVACLTEIMATCKFK